ncbi:MAG: transcription-repair coupling factor, partial [Treponema sp.]|nr:transcription-repair coupling factor [Treponema sp.]
MNTLSFPSFLSVLSSSGAVSACLSAWQEGKFPLEIEGPEGAFQGILLSALCRGPEARRRPAGGEGGPFIAVVSTESEAAELALDLRSSGLPAEIFPWWGVMPYREMAPASGVFGERAKVLSALAAEGPGPSAASPPLLFIVPERAFLTPLPPPDYLRSLLIPLAPGDRVDTAALAETLVSYGYTRVSRVQLQGEFALRGEVLDILMGGDDMACRLLLDYDRVESLRLFDPVDQSSGGAKAGKPERILIRPLREVVWTDERIEALGDNLAGLEEFSGGGREILEELMERRAVPGEELLYPLAFSPGTSAVLPDYLGSGGTVFFIDRERLEKAQEAREREYENLYRRARRETGGRVPDPSRILLNFSELAGRIKRRVSFVSIKGAGEEGALRVEIPCDPPRSFFGNINYLKEEFAALLRDGWKISVAAESDIQAERIAGLLGDTASPGLRVEASPFSAGFALPDIRFMLVQENEIFGRRKRVPPSVRAARSAAIDSFIELNPGDFVVHLNYGIGLFKGIERIRALGYERDYIKLE